MFLSFGWIQKKEAGRFVAIQTFLCYAQKDERMAQQLKEQLSVFEQQGLITLWDHGSIRPGAEWEQEINEQLANAQIILLLISASFIASNYHYRIEMRQAIDRHERREARVIPVILRPVLWETPPIDKLQALPYPPKPLTDWNPRDTGFMEVAIGIAKVIEQLNTHSLPDPLAAREKFMEGFDKLIAAVETQMQPPGRAHAVARTLQQLSNLTPIEVTLADLIIGWRIVAQPIQKDEDVATVQRRATCSELATLATPIIQEQGTIMGALNAWQSWQKVFTNSNDPRREAMAQTFARELSELKASTR